MTRHYMPSTELGRVRTPSAWVEIHDHLRRGDEVVITHYRKPVALITPYPREEPRD